LPSGSEPSSPPVNQTAAPDAAPGNSPPPADGAGDEYEPLTPELVEEEAIRGDFVLRLMVVLLAFLLGSTRIADTSTLVRVKTGEYLAEHGWIPPAHDVFSYTAKDRPWTNLSWGFDLLAAGIHALGSFAGLSVFKAFVVAGVFWLIGRISRPGIPSWWGSVCGAGALLACHLRIAVTPVLATYLGITLSLALMHRWRESAAAGLAGRGSKRLWLFVPLMVVWANFDPRAWLGLAYLVLFAAGDSLGAWWNAPTALPAGARRELWKVTAASMAAMLVHPFGWKALAAPWHVYAVEYPAFRDYITERYVGGEEIAPAGVGLMYFPMTTGAFWEQLIPEATWTFWQPLDIAALASMAVLLAAAVTFVLNRSRQDWGHLAVYLGFVLLAAACLHELPAAAIVAAVVAALNGQAWYAAACRQTYSIERRDLLLSQGGRALTVLVLAGIAFFGGTGRLRDSTGSPARTGYGLDPHLEVQLDDLRQQLADKVGFDHRPFNVLLTQGDQLIWVGEEVFVDSRVGVYYSREETENLLARQLAAREALRAARPRDVRGSAAGAGGAGWKDTFDKFEITHVVLRLVSNKDSELCARLLQDTSHWEWTSLGPTAAVFYRAPTTKDSPLAEWIEAHKIDFRKRAYHGEPGGADLTAQTGRSRGIRPPSLYQKYFWSKRHISPPEVLEAGQLVQWLGFSGLPQRLQQSRVAMAYLAIRRAQAGLETDPDDVSGYLVLGQAYDFLSRIEAAAANGARPPRSGVRYLQSIAAYNQALVGEPDNRAAHAALMRMYLEAQRPDLALRHMQAYDELLAADPDVNPGVLNELERQIDQIRKGLESVSAEVVARSGAERDPMKLIAGYLQRQCRLKALTEMDAVGDALAGNLELERLRISLLLETGRIEEAYDAAGRLAGAAERGPLADWKDIVALASLVYGDYSGAALRWQSAADDIELQSLNGMLLSLAPHPTADRWPLSTTKAMFEYLYRHPEMIAGVRTNVALVHLEQGHIDLAEQYFHDVLAAAPDTINRPFIAYYLWELSDGKEEIDMTPPSDRVFELFAPEPDAAGESEE
jgi:tetratricopeptide (TPR) repeat protein